MPTSSVTSKVEINWVGSSIFFLSNREVFLKWNKSGTCRLSNCLGFIVNGSFLHNSSYPGDPRFSDRQVWANIVECDQGLHSLPFQSVSFGCITLWYCNDPKFSDTQVWANSADLDQRSSLIRSYTVCNSLCIFWMQYSKVKPSCSTFRVITENFRVSDFLGILQ